MGRREGDCHYDLPGNTANDKIICTARLSNYRVSPFYLTTYNNAQVIDCIGGIKVARKQSCINSILLNDIIFACYFFYGCRPIANRSFCWCIGSAVCFLQTILVARSTNNANDV
jgi:hypothetical protein